MIDPAHGDDALSEEIARIQAMIRSPGFRRTKPAANRKDAADVSKRATMRPRNAATLVLLDRGSGNPDNARILMGKRHHSLAFMPGALVFPGGAVDSTDGSVPTDGELPDATHEKITANMRGKASSRAARALGIAAIRELAEETGILIGNSGNAEIGLADWRCFEERAVIPSMSGFSLLARAITPPGPPRRFDTWFFVVDAKAIGHVPEDGFEPSGELEQLEWIRPEDAIGANTREITRVMLVELMNRLREDPGLEPHFPAPFYYTARNRFMRALM